MINKKTVTIIRSAVGSLASVGFLKFLKENGFKIVGTDILEENVGKFFVDSFYKVPKANREYEVVKSYLSIAKKEGASWIISGPEEEIIVLSKHKDVFKSEGIYILHPDYEPLNIITDKYNAYTFFKRKGVFLPPTELATDIKNEKKDSKCKFILKPRKGRGSTNITVFSTPKDIAYETLENLQDFIVQDYIEGAEYTVDTLCDLEGNVLNIIPRKRIKVDSGITVIGITERNKELINITEKILSTIKVAGGACFQFIRSNETGIYYLTDINPRFGGGSILSLKSSRTFRKNFKNLLSFRWDKLLYKSYEFDELAMFRYYGEIYEPKF